MKDKKHIENQIGELNTFKSLTEAYTEIASIRMKNTRNSVLKNRDYMASLDDVFKDVRVSYARDVLNLGKKKLNQEKVTFLSHNGKSVGVFLSANTGLYGDIIERTFEKFMKEAKQENLEITIVGKLGLSMLQSFNSKIPYTYFDLSDRKIEPGDLSEILRHLVQYEEIRVYYPRYESAVKQEASKYIVSAETPLSEIKQREKDKTYYLFEPSLKEILIFFEKEIFASLLDQTVRESQLAKFAARIISLDRAGENIKQRLKKLNNEKLRAEHRKTNRKQNERLVSIFV